MRKRSRRRWLLVSVLAILAIAVSAFEIANFSYWPSGTVTPIQLKDYASAYLAEYKTLYLDNTPLVAGSTTPYRFTFGISPPNAITEIISFSHGALILFNSSTSSSFHVGGSTMNKPIEYYLWPNMPQNPQASGTGSVVIANGTYPLDAPVTDPNDLIVISPGAIVRYNGTGDAFRLSGNASIIISGTLIFTQRMILKGSNSPAAWSTLQGQFDAFDQFIADGHGIFNTTVVQQIQTKYRVPLLLTLIGNRIADGSYRNNPSLFTVDYNELSNYATNSTLQQVQNDYYANQKVVPPSLSSDVTALISNPLFVGVVSAVVGVIVGSVVTTILGRRSDGRVSS